MSETTQKLPDQKQRDAIRNELNTTMLVEAAAGTGKTTEMVARMVSMLREGVCTVDKMAAITFTRKAAAEMRTRFQAEVEQRARAETGDAAERLKFAADNVSKCYIGTIHSFCAKLLRERPVEARVPLEFEQIEEDADTDLRLEAWDSYCHGLFVDDPDDVLIKMNELGVEIGDLSDAFVKFATYPDVERWPSSPQSDIPDVKVIKSKIGEYIEYLKENVYPLINEEDSDDFQNFAKKLPFFFNQTDWDSHASVETLLENFEKMPSTTQRCWPGDNRKERKAYTEAEEACFTAVSQETAQPFLEALYQHRYQLIMEVFKAVKRKYDQLRLEHKVLNFQDLLMLSAKLLREGGEDIRRYFHSRFSHLLVDEFQDTDPIQAEVMMLLASEDPAESDWRRCRPRPGSLFIVGDPKQSIYRFRRADLVTYNAVKKQIRDGGGKLATLSANFRSLKPILDWVNVSFNERFNSLDAKYSPDYVRMVAGKNIPLDEPDHCVCKIAIPDVGRKVDARLDYEVPLISSYIKQAIESGMIIKCPEDDGDERPVRASDFLIVTWKKKHMSRYARELDQLGIPNAVTGGTVLNEVSQVRQLYIYLSALAHPHNPVFLVAVLRSGLFGIDDRLLYEFKRRGGEFDWRQNVPGGMAEEQKNRMQRIFDRFKKDVRLISTMPPVAAIERISDKLGLQVTAAASAGGNIQAGSLGKVFEILRSKRADYWSFSQMVEFLSDIAKSDEAYDGVPARSLQEDPVRIMNLHKVKGLQAPIVFLADPSGKQNQAALKNRLDFHIDRESADSVYGYLKISKSLGEFQSKIVAIPPGWEDKMEEEWRFHEAENDRLLYVAATRAGSKVVVSQLEKFKNSNPWYSLEENLYSAPELCLAEVDGGDSEFERTDGMESEIDSEAEKGQIIQIDEELLKFRRDALFQPGFERRRAKPDAPSMLGLNGQEYGMEWGEVLHHLIEVKLREPDAEICSLAVSAVRQKNLPESFIQPAVDMVESLFKYPGGVLERALNSELFMTEVPFHYQKGGDDGRPVFISGAIDLVFKEDEGWVIVDYKTDKSALEKPAREKLKEKYRSQLCSYVEGWKECTGEEVKEAGIFFTEPMEYVEMDISEIS